MEEPQARVPNLNVGVDMSFIKQLFGIAPTAETDGEGYIPSPLGRLLGVDSKSGYKPADFSGTYSGDKRVLVLCTQERYLQMTNGKKFSTGHNVQETAVPLMHLRDAGFGFDVVTPTGAPAILEDWSVPKKDAAVLSFMNPDPENGQVAGGALDQTLTGSVNMGWRL